VRVKDPIAMSAKAVASKLIPSTWRRNLREKLVAASVRHIRGPKSLALAGDEAIVTCVMKNGEYYIESFIRHYASMGFRHIFFMDNGSTDHTLEIAASYENVSVCRSNLPISENQRLFKAYLARTSARGGWCLDVDIDELFDYPRSEVVDLSGLLQYLNKYGYNAVITQMLDLFSDRPLLHLLSTKREDIKEIYRYYDISEVSTEKYAGSKMARQFGANNSVAAADASLYWGGIRKTLYGNDCLLTKHSLFANGAGLELFPHVHFVDKARLADLYGVLLHYKLTANAMTTATQNRDEFKQNSKTYGAFIELLDKDPNRVIKAASAGEFKSATEMAESGFLLTSPRYDAYAHEREMTGERLGRLRAEEQECRELRA
jgi:glycosyltransferase involved in cell wall biosynthesis